METTTATKKINWLFPDENQTVTIDDFREMVREADMMPAYSYEEHRQIVNEWLQNHQCPIYTLKAALINKL
ncbi:MAG: hypothetical protein LBN23_07565 [Paludibacter sp.]|jgi:hypothetical protein|nr:hypothetical protein [Paludibacter sp.]